MAGAPIKIVVVADPAAGAEWSQAVPAGKRWLVHTVRYQIVTSATVANRTPHIIIDDGANELHRNGNAGAVAASLTALISAFLSRAAATGLSFTGVGFNTRTFPLPDLELLPGWRIRSITDAIQAGDQLSAIRLTVEEWDA